MKVTIQIPDDIYYSLQEGYPSDDDIETILESILKGNVEEE